MTFSVRRGDVPDLTADPSLAEKELSFKHQQNWKQCAKICGIGSLKTLKDTANYELFADQLRLFPPL